MRPSVLLVFLIALISGSPTSAEPPKIAIIGAGLAGLTAAYRLQTMGSRAEVYEARTRPGGRCFTAYFAKGHEELGGKSLEDAGDPVHILQLVAELGLTIAPHIDNVVGYLGYDGDLTPYPRAFENAPEATEQSYKRIQAIQAQARNLRDIIDSFWCSQPLLARLMNDALSGYESSPSCRLAPEYLDTSLWGLYKRFVADHQRRMGGQSIAAPKNSVKGGNSRLVWALASGLGDRVHYQYVLRRISSAENGCIRLQFANGECVLADYVLLTLPCSTLRDVEIEEGLIPPDQLFAIRTLQYGTAAKMLIPVQVPQSSFVDSVLTSRIYTWFNTDYTVMTWWYIADAGIFDSHSKVVLKQLIEREIDTCRRAYPQLEFPYGLTPTTVSDTPSASYLQPVGISWACEEFSKGSYCTYAPGQFALFNETVIDHQETVRKVFHSIGGRLFFAGEHTAEEINTLSGAVQSGERAARMIQRAQQRAMGESQGADAA